MRKKSGIIKRALSLLLIFLLSINSFAAIVSDNDGSAFVTKQEFEALKNSFASQIQSYNDSIDGKIDGAIAQYLSGLQRLKASNGENYLKKINAIRPVLFYSNSSNTLYEEDIDNLKTYYMWKYFGCHITQYKDTYWNDSSNYTRRTWTTAMSKHFSGSWILDIFNNQHNRTFHFEEKGNDTNYIYSINKLKISGNEYPYVTQDKTFSATATIGAYYVRWGADHTNYTAPPTSYTFSHKDIDITSFKTNSIEPESIEVNLGLADKYQHDGAQFTNWSRKDNATDSLFLYNFTNTTYAQDKNLLCVTPEDYVTWTATKKLTSQHITAGDWWMNFFDNGGYKRTYTWQDWSCCDDVGITGYYDATKGSLKYSLPNFKTYTSNAVINYEASSVIGSAVHPFNGVPVTKVEKNTNNIVIDFVCKLYNASGTLQSGKPYNIIISYEPFNNISSADIITAGDTQKIKIFKNTTGTSTFEINLDQSYIEAIPVNSIIYARIAPVDTNLHAQIDCDNVIYYVEG